jgi:hypothetical protein
VNLLLLVTVPTGAVVLLTLIKPLLAPDGTVASSSVEDTNVVAAATPLTLTVEAALKPRPLTVTTVPAVPLKGVKLVIAKVGENSAVEDEAP